MTTTLIISAHPSRIGFTHKIVARIKDRKVQAGVAVEVVDLYSEVPLSYLQFEGKDGISIDEVLKAYQDQITRADELFFIFPCWWGDCPAIMRNWFDHVFSKGFAFITTKGRPKGLLFGKDCHVIMTTGTPAIFYRLSGVTRAMRRIWNTTRIRFCGMRPKGFLVIGGMDREDRNEVDAFRKSALFVVLANFRKGTN